MRLILAAAAVTALHACASAAPDDRQQAARAAISTLEQKVPLPDATRPLGNYERYYAVSDNRIDAVYLSSRGGPGRVHLVGEHELPRVKDEGCSVVTVAFERASGRFERVLCNDIKLAGRAPAVAAPGKPLSKGERG